MDRAVQDMVTLEFLVLPDLSQGKKCQFIYKEESEILKRSDRES